MIKSDLYYSDEVEAVFEFDPNNANGVVETATAPLRQFLTQIDDQVSEWEAQGTKNILSSFHIDPLSEMLVCKMAGSLPWGEDKVEAFHKEISEKKEQDDAGALDLLKGLIEQYPDATVAILAGVLKQK